MDVTGGIRRFLMEHAGSGSVSFHMPGHKGGDIYRRYGYDDFLARMMDCDITEIAGADNLFSADGIIKETEEKYRELYGVRSSHLLINGTSGGLIAAVLSSVRPEGKLIMARNCHKSVYNALRLGGISPVYAYPSTESRYGICGPLEAGEVERLLCEEPGAEAVILPSPDYYGVCSDIRAIADTVHRHGKILIVDQAHGAHLKFMDMCPAAAEDCGADIVVNSTHKTLASFTQSAVLNVVSDRVDIRELEDRLQMTESSSPSYILMASLDINADIIAGHGDELFGQWEENLRFFYSAAGEIDGVGVVSIPGVMDRTKIDISMAKYGIDGKTLERILMGKGIFAELSSGDLVMCMSGIGNTRSDMERLAEALAETAEEHREDYDPSLPSFRGDVRTWNKRRKVYDTAGRRSAVRIEECAGRICGQAIIPYPPGIPLVCPGEMIGEDDIELISSMEAFRYNVIGIDEEGRAVVFD